MVLQSQKNGPSLGRPWCYGKDRFRKKTEPLIAQVQWRKGMRGVQLWKWQAATETSVKWFADLILTCSHSFAVLFLQAGSMFMSSTFTENTWHLTTWHRSSHRSHRIREYLPTFRLCPNGVIQPPISYEGFGHRCQRTSDFVRCFRATALTAPQFTMSDEWGCLVASRNTVSPSTWV